MLGWVEEPENDQKLRHRNKIVFFGVNVAWNKQSVYRVKFLTPK